MIEFLLSYVYVWVTGILGVFLLVAVPGLVYDIYTRYLSGSEKGPY